MPNATEYKFNKELRKTPIDIIQAREKTMKGPADYSPERKHKVKGHYNTTVPIGGFMNETEFLATQSPACIKYEADAQKIAQKRRSPNASLVRDGKGPRPICLPYKKDDSPNPFTYKDVDTKWTHLSPHRREIRQVWRKEKSGTWLEKHQKQKDFIPGPGHREVPLDVIKKTSTSTYNNARRR